MDTQAIDALVVQCTIVIDQCNRQVVVTTEQCGDELRPSVTRAINDDGLAAAIAATKEHPRREPPSDNKNERE